MKNKFILSALLLLCLTVSAYSQYNYGGTRTSITINGYTGFVIEPTVARTDGSKPWLWYAPTNTSYPNSNNSWILSQLVAKGFWIFGVDVGETYGSPTGTAIYSLFFDSVMTRYQLNPKGCLFAQSRGGLLLYNWAYEYDNSSNVSRIAGIYPVGNLSSYPGVTIASNAYGVSQSFMSEKYDSLSPMGKLDKLYGHSVPIFHIHGDSDYLVPLSDNSQILHDRYTALGGDFTLEVVEGQGHAEIPQYFESQNLLDFIFKDTLQSFTNPTQPVHQESSLYIAPNPSSQSTFIYDNDGLDGAKIDILDMTGIKAKSTNNLFGQKAELDLHELPKGCYMVRVEKNSKSKIVRFILN